jgi:spore germination protein GerM
VTGLVRIAASVAGLLAACAALTWVAKNALAATATDQNRGTDTYPVVQHLLRTLVSGPSKSERATGLSTDLAPDSSLALLELSGRTVVVQIQPATPIPADRLPLAIGQVVLTVTSAPDVDRVVLRDTRQRLQIPKPGGALTASPVAAQDYTSLIRGGDRKHSDTGCDRSKSRRTRR